MTWKPGQSGNPKGRKVEKLFADALRMALSEEDQATGKRKLRMIAEKMVAEAVRGEAWAITAVADRLDGKPGQSIDVTEHVDLGTATLEELQAAAAEIGKNWEEVVAFLGDDDELPVPTHDAPVTEN